MNRSILLGRLTRDPEIRTGTNSKAARFTLAVDREFKVEGQPTADFINCVAFGKSADLAENYLYKGKQICVLGRIQTGSYVNNDGKTVYTTDIVCDRIEFTGSKADDDRMRGNNGGGAAAQNTQTQAKAKEEPMPDMNIPEGTDEELPFS